MENVNIELRLIGLVLFIFFLKGLSGCNNTVPEQPAQDVRAYNDSLLKLVEVEQDTIKSDSLK